MGREVREVLKVLAIHVVADMLHCFGTAIRCFYNLLLLDLNVTQIIVFVENFRNLKKMEFYKAYGGKIEV